MKTLVQLTLACLMLAGCATAPDKIATVAGADISPLKTERAAVSYQLVDKRINYDEKLYRVLWLENKSSAQDFSGIWSADQDLSEYVVERLRQQGLKADSIYQAVDGNTIGLAKAAERAYVLQNATAHPGNPATKLLPVPQFFTEMPTEPAFTGLATELRSKGYRYLVQLTAMNLIGSAQGMGIVVVGAETNVRVIDLQANKVVWNAKAFPGELYHLGGDIKQLEVDGMARTKQGLRTGIQKMDFSGLWGL